MRASVIMVKSIDWSTFTSGFNIPVEMQPALYALIGRTLEIGERIPIKILFNGEVFDTQLQNSDFNRKTFAKHKTDIVRIMYGKGSLFAHRLRQFFSSLYDYMRILKDSLPPRTQIKAPKDLEQRITLSFTGTPGVFEIEPISSVDITPEQVSEEVFESIDATWIDRTARIEEREKISRIRMVDRSICDNLKKLYDYRCQVTGEKIGDGFGFPVVEAHHIDYFVNSQNNDSSNIVIISPNFHRIIHASNPTFNHESLQFEFPNGVVEGLALNFHLKKKKRKSQSA